MAYNQFSHPVAPPDLYSPIGDDILLRGAMQTYENAAKAGQNLSAYNSKLFGINTYGKDAEVLADYENQFNQNVAELSQHGISSPEAMSRMNTLISSYTNNPDILAIHRRANAYNNELKAQKEAEAKGKTYVSPILRQGNKYYSGSNYYRDKQFNGSGFVAPDNKELDEIAKNTPEWERWTTQGGYDIHQKGKAEESLYINYLTHFTNNLQWKNLIEDQFEQSIEGVDLNQLMANLNQYISQLFPYLPDQEKQNAINTLSQYQQMQGTPFFESAVKDKLRNDYFKNQAYMAAQAKTYVNTVDMRANDFAKSARDFQEAKSLKLYELQLKTGLTPNKGESTEAYVKRLSQEAQRKDLEIAQAKSDIIENRQRNLEDQKQENRIEIKKLDGTTAGVNLKGGKKIQLEGKYEDKETILGDLARENTSVIKNIIEQYPNIFFEKGANTKIDPSSFGDKTGIEIVEKDGKKWVTFEPDALIGGKNYEIPLDDIMNFVADQNYIPAVVVNNNLIKGSLDDATKPESNITTTKGKYD